MEQLVQNFILQLKKYECKIIRGNTENVIIIQAKISVILEIQVLARKQGHELNRTYRAVEIKNNYTDVCFCRLRLPFMTDRQTNILNFIKQAKQNNERCYAPAIYAAFPDTDISLIAGDMLYLQGEGHITRASKDYLSYVPLEVSERNIGISITYVN